MINHQILWYLWNNLTAILYNIWSYFPLNGVALRYNVNRRFLLQYSFSKYTPVDKHVKKMLDHSGDISYPAPISMIFPRNNDPTRKISSKQLFFVFNLRIYTSRWCVDIVSCFAVSCFSFQTHFQTECHQRCSSTVEKRIGEDINSSIVMQVEKWKQKKRK